jgi:ubiquinone/menaquinone biosynthesis C-methylase UbiE
MSDLSRWRTAQEAEAAYEHFETPGQGVLADIRNRFDLSVEELAGASVLEVGAGNGPVYQIDEARWRVGVDPLYTRRHEALERVARQSGNGVITGVGESLPFADDSFSTAICYNVLDHVYDPLRILEEMRRVLETDGKLYLVVHTFRGPKLVRELITYIDSPHPHRFSQREVTRLVKEAGFSLLRTDVSSMDPFSGDSLKWKIASGVFGIADAYYEATS